MDPETLPTKPEPTSPAPHRSRWRRVLAVGAGVAMVPALYAVSSAATGGGVSPSTVAAHSRASDDPGTEVEVEHGVEVAKPHGGIATPTVPEATTPTTPAATTTTTPPVTAPEAEHPVAEPGDDHGVDGGDDDGTPVTPAPPTTQSFSSAGGSITVSGEGSTISLASSSPAAGFTTEVHDNGPTRVEVRFSSGGTEWRIRVELVGGGALTSEVTQHG